MNELVKTMVTSSVIASVLSGIISWLISSYKIEHELHSRQIEAGYEALVMANTQLWQSDALMEEAKVEKDDALAAKGRKLRREADASYTAARLKIAAFGDERVVKAMADYYRYEPTVTALCKNTDKFRLDTRIYKAIRDTLGVGGTVSDQDLATVIFRCSLK